MDSDFRTPNALTNPRNRQLWIVLGVALVALIILLAIWQNSGTHGARRDVAAATDKVIEKQREVDDARRALEQKVSELRALQANADAQGTRLSTEVESHAASEMGNAPIAGAVVADPGQEYYVRDRRGRFVRVTPRAP